MPRRTAEIHTVVLGEHRGRGVGKALVEAAERVAAEHGVAVRYAGILTRNHGAVRCYAAAGYEPRGALLRKELDRPGR